MAVAAATDVLWALSGRQFGTTSVALRPLPDCRAETPFPDGWEPWPGTVWPPLGANGAWGWGPYWPVGFWCSCSSTAVKLPAPVKSITAVKVAGATLAPSAYRVDDNRYVRRIDGFTWPNTNNLLHDDTQTDTWSITALYGSSVPDGGALAVGELACELIRAYNGEDCRLPRGVSQIARQGVTISFPDPVQQFSGGLTGLYLCDLFIQTWNPTRIRSRARVFSVERPPHPRVGT
jgi:hypothetical protein